MRVSANVRGEAMDSNAYFDLNRLLESSVIRNSLYERIVVNDPIVLRALSKVVSAFPGAKKNIGSKLLESREKNIQ